MFVQDAFPNDTWGWPQLGMGCNEAEGCFNVTNATSGAGIKFWGFLGLTWSWDLAIAGAIGSSLKPIL